MPNLRSAVPGIQVYDEGVLIQRAIQVDYIGAGVTAASGGAARANVTIPGGGGGLTSINDQIANSTRQGNVAANVASAAGASAFGGTTGGACTASGTDSHAEGNGSVASGTSSHAEGSGTTAAGAFSHTEGATSSTNAAGIGAHAEGVNCQANGTGAHAEGQTSIASNSGAHAEGNATSVTGSGGHAEGNQTVAGGTAAHAEGSFCQTSATNAHAQGLNSRASGIQSHAEGEESVATLRGEHAHATGSFGGPGSGDAQYRRAIVLGDITAAGELLLAQLNRIVLTNNHTYAIKIMCSGRGISAGVINDDTYLRLEALVRVAGGVVTIVGQTTTVIFSSAGAAAWTINVSNPAGTDLAVNAVVTVGETVHMSAKVEMMEVG